MSWQLINGIFIGRGGGSAGPNGSPSNLVLTVDSDVQISLSWINGSTNLDGTNIYISTDNINFTLKGIVTGNSILFPATSLTSGTQYYFYVAHYKGSVESIPSDVATATTFNNTLIAGWKFDDNASLFQLTEYSTHPLCSESGIYYNGKTYIVYQGVQVDGDPYITSYDHATGLWTAPVFIADNPLPNDAAHGAPSLVIDDNGYFHVVFGCHNTAIKYCKSTNPNDITAWTAMSDIAAMGTYTQLIKLSTGVIYLFYRKTSVTDDWGYQTTDDGGVNWSAYTSVILDYAYCKFKKGADDVIHCSMNGNNVTDFERFNLYYTYFDGTNWKNIEGTNLTLPMDITDASSILVHNSGLNYIPLSVVSSDSSNKPYILFTEGETPSEIATYNYKLAKYSGGVWSIINIGISTDVFQDYPSAIDVKSLTEIDVYLISGGTAGVVGGITQKWVSTNAGDTWAFDQNLINNQCWSPVLIDSYHANAKLIIQRMTNSTNYILNLGYVWGDSGFISNTNLPYSFYSTKNTYPLYRVGTVTLVAGQYGKAINIQAGTGNQLVLGDDDVFYFGGGSPDKPFTFTAWVNVSNTSNATHIIYKRATSKHEYNFYIQTNKVQLLCLNNTATAYILATAPFTTVNEWVFLCGTYSGSGLASGLKIYINLLESQDSQAMTGSYTGMGNYDVSPTIGASTSTHSRSIDEFKIFSAVLTPAQMTLVMNNDPSW